jgi:hypothetical protein
MLDLSLSFIIIIWRSKPYISMMKVKVQNASKQLDFWIDF